MSQGRKKLDLPREPRDNKPCKKHTWVYYHSEGKRRCIDCPAAEDLWADFGLTKRTDE